MSWTTELTKHGTNGDYRLCYAQQPDNVLRFFLLQPGHNYIELVYTRVYETVNAGVASLVSDYQAAQLIAPGCCPECGYLLPDNPRAKYCSAECQTRAYAREYYHRKVSPRKSERKKSA